MTNVILVKGSFPGDTSGKLWTLALVENDGSQARREKALDIALGCARKSWQNLTLAFARTPEEVEQAEMELGRLEDWASD